MAVVECVEPKTHQRSRSSDNTTLAVVLGAVARADELVLRLVPRHDAPEVSAHRVDPVRRKCVVVLHNQVRRISL